MLSERAFRWFSLFGSTCSQFFLLPFVRDKKTGGLKVGSWFLVAFFQIFSFPSQFHLAYSIVSILLEMRKFRKNIQAIYFSTMIFCVTLAELFTFQGVLSAKHRMLKVMKDLMKLSKYCKGKKVHSFSHK